MVLLSDGVPVEGSNQQIILSDMEQVYIDQIATQVCLYSICLSFILNSIQQLNWRQDQAIKNACMLVILHNHKELSHCCIREDHSVEGALWVTLPSFEL